MKTIHENYIAFLKELGVPNSSNVHKTVYYVAAKQTLDTLLEIGTTFAPEKEVAKITKELEQYFVDLQKNN